MIAAINGHKVNYEIKGQGSPILFVHGWGGNINSLRALAYLASTKYQTIILDLPGFGQSDNPNPEWGIAEYADLLTELIQSLQLKKINYFGHSYGGSLGIYLSAHNPELIDKLILCDSSYKRTGKTSKAAKILKKTIGSLPILNKFEPFVKKIMYKIFFPDSDLIKFPHLESNFRKIMTQDLTQHLNKINCPTLILWGDKDIDTPVSLAHELKEKIKNSKLIFFKDATHSLPLKKPDEVYEEVRKFMMT